MNKRVLFIRTIGAVMLWIGSANATDKAERGIGESLLGLARPRLLLAFAADGPARPYIRLRPRHAGGAFSDPVTNYRSGSRMRGAPGTREWYVGGHLLKTQ